MTQETTEAPEVPEETPEEAENDRRVMAARTALYDALARVRIELDAAQSAHQRLDDGDTWDAEYEGGGEFADHIRELSRLLDITRGVMPTGPNGDFEKEITVVNAAFKATRTSSYLK